MKKGRPYIVLLVNSDLEFGGAQRQIIELANNMDFKEFDVHVCSFANYVPLADLLKHRDKRLHILCRKGKFDFTVVIRLALLIRKLKADIVHSYLFDTQIAARLAGLLLARRTVVIGSERNADYIMKKRHLLAYNLTHGLEDLIIANSRSGAVFNGRMLRYDASHYRVVHNGVDTERFRPLDKSGIRIRFGLGRDEYIVGMFASFKPQKNHPVLLRAAVHVIEKIGNVKFLFVGDALYKGMSDSVDYKYLVKNLIQELGIGEKCILHGNSAHVQELYNSCDLTVLPSLFEGTPNVALESMACGIPVIATDVSDNALIIPDGKAGYIVPVNDEQALAQKITELFSDNEKRLAMGQMAREWVVDGFSSRRLAKKTAEVYYEALRAKRIE